MNTKVRERENQSSRAEKEPKKLKDRLTQSLYVKNEKPGMSMTYSKNNTHFNPTNLKKEYCYKILYW